MPTNAGAHRIAVLVTDGLFDFELAVPTEVFGIDRSDIVAPWYDFRLCATGPPRPRTHAGLIVDTPYGLDDLVDADTVVVPACDRAFGIAPSPDVLDALREAHRRGARIASICTGAYLLAAAGLLDGRPATTHWMNAVDFAHRYPEVRLDPDVLYVDDGDVLTSAGTSAGIDLCLHIVRRDFGAAVANTIARRMVIPAHREGGQSQYVELPLPPPRADTGLAPLLDWAVAHLDEPLTVADLARRVHQSPRTFARRFRDATGTTPLHWLLQQRVRLAQQLLESTDEPVERIAERTGFGTAANLRVHFARVTSVSPKTYRHVFSRRGQGVDSSDV
jgi:transcriptional regulator GlxA family with amidase domain